MVSDLTFTKTNSEFPFPWFSAALVKFQIADFSGSGGPDTSVHPVSSVLV